MRRVRLDKLRWLAFVAACGGAKAQPIDRRPEPPSIEDLGFLAGCWERLNHGVETVRWTREARDWSGRYEQHGPKDIRVRADLHIRADARGLEVVTSNIECAWSTCVAPFQVEGAIEQTVAGYTVFGAGSSALWLGYERSRDELLFGQAEANPFTRCEQD